MKAVRIVGQVVAVLLSPLAVPAVALILWGIILAITTPVRLMIYWL